VNEWTTLDEPLSDDEIEELDDFLVSEAVCDDAMDVAMMDGFFAALIGGPRPVAPADALRWVWDETRGKREPEFASPEQAKRILALVLRHWNDVAYCLASAEEPYVPLILENRSGDTPVSIIDEWCVGYWHAVELSSKQWQPLLDEHPDWLEVVRLYGTEEGWEELKQRQHSLDEHERLAESLGPLATRIHEYWREIRVRAAAQSTSRKPDGRTEYGDLLGRVGRSDPCPCGSGRPFDACHGGDAVPGPTMDLSDDEDDDPDSSGRSDAGDSPLSCKVARDGTEVSIEIYADGDGRWILEVVDEFHNSNVWDEVFATDAAALEAAMRVIETHGIASLIGPPPRGVTRH
jgi:uncharacterized protein